MYITYIHRYIRDRKEKRRMLHVFTFETRIYTLSFNSSELLFFLLYFARLNGIILLDRV